jgi:hypothetical protein
MGYNISALEGRNGGKDWPLIVEAVPCETCGAKEGEKCVSVGTAKINAFFTPGAERIDYHATRKQFAAHVWYSGKAEGVPEEEIASLVAGQNSRPASESVPEIADTAETKIPESEVGAVEQIQATDSAHSGKEEESPTQATTPEIPPPPTVDTTN